MVQRVDHLNTLVQSDSTQWVGPTPQCGINYKGYLMYFNQRVSGLEPSPSRGGGGDCPMGDESLILRSRWCWHSGLTTFVKTIPARYAVHRTGYSIQLIYNYDTHILYLKEKQYKSLNAGRWSAWVASYCVESALKHAINNYFPAVGGNNIVSWRWTSNCWGFKSRSQPSPVVTNFDPSWYITSFTVISSLTSTDCLRADKLVYIVLSIYFCLSVLFLLPDEDLLVETSLFCLLSLLKALFTFVTLNSLYGLLQVHVHLGAIISYTCQLFIIGISTTAYTKSLLLNSILVVTSLTLPCLALSRDRKHIVLWYICTQSRWYISSGSKNRQTNQINVSDHECLHIWNSQGSCFEHLFELSTQNGLRFLMISSLTSGQA